MKQLLKMFLQSIVLPLVYRVYSYKQINDRLVVFADSQHDEIPFSMRKLYEEIVKRGYEVTVYTQDNSKLPFGQIILSMIRFMKLYASAKHVIICDYYLPIAACNKKEDTFVTQLWHAGGLMKKFGYDTKDDIPSFYRGNVFKNYNLVTVSAECCEDVFRRAMRLPEGVAWATGLSRTDYFFDSSYIKQCAEEFFLYYPEAKGKKIITWAPTFRGKASNPYLVGEEAIMELQDKLGDEYNVVIKVHPHLDVKGRISNCNISTERILPVTDLLITDYSSVFFDYLILGRPAILFVPDKEEYEKRRGLNVSFSQLSAKIVIAPETLESAVQEVMQDFSKYKRETCYQQYMGACDGHSTDRILQRLKIS